MVIYNMGINLILNRITYCLLTFLTHQQFLPQNSSFNIKELLYIFRIIYQKKKLRVEYSLIWMVHFFLCKMFHKEYFVLPFFSSHIFVYPQGSRSVALFYEQFLVIYISYCRKSWSGRAGEAGSSCTVPQSPSPSPTTTRGQTYQGYYQGWTEYLGTRKSGFGPA